jgi:hypothetical protein
MKRAHSYSSLSTYRKCPKYFHWCYVLGNKEPDKPAAMRGHDLHAKLEEFFKGAPYPSRTPALKPWQRFMENLTKYNPEPEAEIAVNSEWIPCAFDDKDAYARGKIDLRYTLGGVRHILDWKSGRVYDDHPEQGKMYMAIEPDLWDDYETEFVYLDIPLHTTPRRYVRGAKQLEIVKLTNLIEIVNHDTEYVATPSRESCLYCPLSWRKGGQCRAAP